MDIAVAKKIVELAQAYKKFDLDDFNTKLKAVIRERSKGDELRNELAEAKALVAKLEKKLEPILSGPATTAFAESYKGQDLDLLVSLFAKKETAEPKAAEGGEGSGGGQTTGKRMLKEEKLKLVEDLTARLPDAIKGKGPKKMGEIQAALGVTKKQLPILAKLVKGFKGIKIEGIKSFTTYTLK